MTVAYIPSIRRSASSEAVGDKLGFLRNLRGTWTGEGFNLVARPDRQGESPLFLELNQTFETLNFIPISSSIPNRGNVVDDIELFGLTYQQKITDLVTGGALHIEEGMWVHVPTQDVDATQSVFRLGTVPHGNSLLAQGSAISLDPFTGNPFNPDAITPSNTSPFAVGATIPLPGTLSGFAPYDLSNFTPAAVNFRTPAGDIPARPLPTTILGVPMQDMVLDPVKLLTAALSDQVIEHMVVINIATVPSLLQEQPEGQPPKDILAGLNTGGNILNIPFLQSNAAAETMFATFWIEKIQGPTEDTGFLQLQYVQTVFLNFPVLTGTGAPGASLSWPHVSVATLHKTFGGE
ncbi:heme-binding protein [Lichenicola sp.]|uniref:heme-binding protein n=1 Tax=Lichenicola sp. TaxID=2804529 RepID=UPI003B00C5C8